MALVTCEDCGTVQEYSIFEGTTPCRACGASADRLSPVGGEPVDGLSPAPTGGSTDDTAVGSADTPADGTDDPGADLDDDLRADSDDDPPAQPRTGTDPTPAESRTVLIAEDDDAFRETICRWSAIDDRWEVREAPNGRAALEAADDDVDVLVVDRRMPGLSGPEVVDRLADTPFDGDVLVVSAYEADNDLNEADVDGYMTKPVSRQAYVDALEWLAASGGADEEAAEP